MKSVYDDWTGNVVQEADIRSLDPEAMRAVRATYMSEHPEHREEVSAMDDQEFLSYVGVLKRGKVTVAAMAMKVRRLFRSPPMDTAESPALPMTFPTIIMSTML